MKGNKIFKAAFLVMIISILSRFLGLFRDINLELVFIQMHIKQQYQYLRLFLLL